MDHHRPAPDQVLVEAGPAAVVGLDDDIGEECRGDPARRDRFRLGSGRRRGRFTAGDSGQGGAAAAPAARPASTVLRSLMSDLLPPAPSPSAVNLADRPGSCRRRAAAQGAAAVAPDSQPLHGVPAPGGQWSALPAELGAGLGAGRGEVRRSHGGDAPGNPPIWRFMGGPRRDVASLLPGDEIKVVMRWCDFLGTPASSRARPRSGPSATLWRVNC